MGPVEGVSSLELAIHWRISRAWLNWGKRKGLGGWWDQGRAWPGIGKVGEEGEVEVALVSDELEESGEPSGGEGGQYFRLSLAQGASLCNPKTSLCKI